jgi:hypothetical protein
MQTIYSGESRGGHVKLTSDRDCLSPEIIRFGEHVVVDDADLMTKAHLLEQRGFRVCVDTETIFYESE